MKLHKGCYNVRISVDKDGTPSVEWMDNWLYRKNSKQMEWNAVPDSTKKALQEALVKGTSQ